MSLARANGYIPQFKLNKRVEQPATDLVLGSIQVKNGCGGDPTCSMAKFSRPLL